MGSKKREAKMERVKGREGKKMELESRGELSAAVFLLLAQWPSVNATHRASLLERDDYLCNRKKDGERTCL